MLLAFNEQAKGCAPAAIAELHHDFIFEMGYGAMRLTGRKSLETLFK